MSKPLSPAAQAVKDAALAMYAGPNVRRLAWPLDMPVVAAALRAAADQMLLVIEDPEFFVGNCCETAVRAERKDTCDDLLAIAAELEAQP